jgi:outer membrane protein TolC
VKRKRITALLLVATLETTAYAEVPRLSISLDKALASSLETSDQWKSARSAAAAAQDQVLAQRGSLLPHLSVDGSYRYVTEIPSFSAAPGAPSIQFTTHNQYSIGPTLSWTAFAGGTLIQARRAAEANARAQDHEANAIRRQVRLAARLAYFQAQLASEQVRLFAESFRVEQAQYKDISVRYANGESARVDLLSAEEDLLSRQNQLLQARANLATAIRDLASITRQGENLDPTWPLDDKTILEVAAEMPASTLILSLDPLHDSLAAMNPKGGHSFDLHQPSLEYLSELAESARRTAKSLEGGHWPTLSVLGSLMQEYPNGPIAESVTQKTFGVNLSFPLFEGGSTLYAARAQKRAAEATEENRAQTARNLLDSWQKARDQAESLRVRQTVTRRAADRAAEVARLRYQAYKLGQLRYLDVEDANLKEVQAKVEAATTDVNLLVQLANLESLSEE